MCSMRFSPKVRERLARIWYWADEDESGGLDIDEWTKVFIVLHEILNGYPGEEASMKKEAKEEFR